MVFIPRMLQPFTWKGTIWAKALIGWGPEAMAMSNSATCQIVSYIYIYFAQTGNIIIVYATIQKMELHWFSFLTSLYYFFILLRIWIICVVYSYSFLCVCAYIVVTHIYIFLISKHFRLICKGIHPSIHWLSNCIWF